MCCLRRPFSPAAIVDLSKSEAGSNAIEFGLVAPVLVILLFGLVEGGRMLWTLNALHYSVQEAARCASVDTVNCATTTQIQTYAAKRSGATFAATVFTVTQPACGNQVSATYPIQLSIPFVNPSLTLNAQSCYPI